MVDRIETCFGAEKRAHVRQNPLGAAGDEGVEITSGEGGERLSVDAVRIEPRL